MIRRLSTALSAVSLVLCVATVAVWVRSYFRVDVPMRTDMWPDGPNWYWRNAQARSSDGGVTVLVSGHLVNSRGFADNWTNKPGEAVWIVFPAGSPASPPVPLPGALWFRFDSDRRPGPSHLGPEVIRSDSLGLRVPYWPVVLLTGVAPVAWLRRRRRDRRRAREGRCRACGYDLRGTPEQGGALLDRCPECGAVAAEAGSPT